MKLYTNKAINKLALNLYSQTLEEVADHGSALNDENAFDAFDDVVSSFEEGIRFAKKAGNKQVCKVEITWDQDEPGCLDEDDGRTGVFYFIGLPAQVKKKLSELPTYDTYEAEHSFND